MRTLLAWATGAFVGVQLCTLYWYIPVNQWDYYLTRSAATAHPPLQYLSIALNGSTAEVKYGPTSISMEMEDASYVPAPYMKDYAFVAAGPVEIAGLTGSRFLLRSHAKDRTRMRMSLQQYIHKAIGGTSSLVCTVVWHTNFEDNDGLVDWCTVGDGDLYMIAQLERSFNCLRARFRLP
eukprot:gene26826-16250_t